VRSYGWLAVALAAALSACSGGGRGAGTLLPANQTVDPSGTVRQIQCHVGGQPSSGGGGSRGGEPDATYKLCLGYNAVINGYSDGERIVDAESANTKVVTVVTDTERNRTNPRMPDGSPAFWFDVATVGLGTTTVTLRDARGHTGTVTVAVVSCPGVATPTPTATPTPAPTATPTPGRVPPPGATPTATPTASPTATPTPVPTATPSPTPSATPSPTPAPTATPSPSPTAVPTATPAPTATPSPTPTPAPCLLSTKRSTQSKRGTQTGTVSTC